MKGKVFLDTNILIYLFSQTEIEKQLKCEQIIVELKKSNETIVWSTQVIQEFSINLINKMGHGSDVVKKAIRHFSEFELVINDLSNIEEALDIMRVNLLSFWDSLIVSSASQASCKYLLSEDLTHRQKINEVEIINPFLI